MFVKNGAIAQIAHMEWTVTELSTGERMYTNTTEGITGVAVISDSGKFSYVVMVDDETSPAHAYDNANYSSWNAPYVWHILESLGEAMYVVEQDMREDSLDQYYSIGADYDAYDEYDPYDMEYDTDLHNEW